jgi:hypothetical protein
MRLPLALPLAWTSRKGSTCKLDGFRELRAGTVSLPWSSL